MPHLRAIAIGAVRIDSRQVRAGDLFVALRGEKQDGHVFIEDALSRGAALVVAERPSAAGLFPAVHVDSLPAAAPQPPTPFVCLVPDSLMGLQDMAAYWRRQHDVRVVGITGSVGKTTSKEMSAAVLSQRYRTLKSAGNYNNEIGLPLALLELTSSYERVVLEMGMYGLGEIARLAEIALPQVGVVTNVGPSHLERLGSIERIAQAKAELPLALPSAEDGGVAILNADDPWVCDMRRVTRARVFTFGLAPDADLRADEIESHGLEGIRFRFRLGRESIHARLPILGRHSVHTALSAAAVGLIEGLSWSEIMDGLSDRSAQLRLVAVVGPHGSTILDDTYNASPASDVAALNLLQEMSGRKVAVLGDMYELGSYQQEGHKLVGRRAREVADVLVTVGSLGQIIGEEARKAGLPDSALYMMNTNSEAIEVLRGLIEQGDAVLVKGSRAMHMEEIVSALACADRTPQGQEKES